MRAVLGAVLAGLLGVSVAGQSPQLATRLQAQTPAFEAASVKRNLSPFGPGSGIAASPGRFVATNVPAQTIVRYAMGIGVRQVLEGAPAWIATENYDIVATTGGPRTPEETLGLLRTLLADRFKLVTHREPRPARVYHLVLARADGRLGSDLKPSTLDCDAVARTREEKSRAVMEDAVLSGRRVDASLMISIAVGPPGDPCSQQQRQPAEPGITLAIMPGASMATLAARLAGSLNGQVIDRTGLTGRYDVTLRYQTDISSVAGRLAALGITVASGPPAVGDAPLLDAAVREQLGLRLESHEGTADVVVIDRIERPIDN